MTLDSRQQITTTECREPLRTMEESLLGNEDSSTDNVSHRSQDFWRKIRDFLLLPLFDDKGTASSIASGLFTLFTCGFVVGSFSSKNPDLNGRWYPFLSAIIGYTYFIMWSVSFYPQVVINFKRRTTQGLSRDFCFLNCLGFACYATYNLALFHNPAVRKEYQDRHNGGAVPVQSNDVAFAVHALVLSTITVLQILYYDGWKLPSRIVGVGMLALVLFIGLCGILVATHTLPALDLLYVLSYIKMGITLVKYTPQVILNYQRKSTAGWSIWQILLDFGGGTLSDAQLVLDCHNLGDWTGLTGNLAKLMLGMVSIVFDIVFLVQHYILYPDADEHESTIDEQEPLHISGEHSDTERNEGDDASES